MIPEGATHEHPQSDPVKYYQSVGPFWNYWCPLGLKWRKSNNDDEFFKELLALTSTHDTVQNPKHYQLLPGVEVYDIRQALAAKAAAAGATLDQFSDYDRALEYLLRMWEKNGVEDAQKAAWYLNKLVEKLNGA